MKRHLPPFFVLLLAIALLIGTAAYYQSAKLSGANEWRQHSLEVVAAFSALEARIADGQEILQRFIIDGSEATLARHAEAVLAAKAELSHLRQFFADDVAQLTRVNTFANLFDDYGALGNDIVQRRKEQGHEAAEKTLVNGGTARLMDEMRQSLGDMAQQEKNLLRLREQTIVSHTRWILYLAIIAGLVFASIFVSDFLIREELNKRRRVEAELQRKNRALRTLSACNEVLVRASDEMELLENICAKMVEMGGFRMVWVGFAEQDEGKTVRPAAWAGYEAGYLSTANITWAENERGSGPTGTAIRSGEPALARNAAGNPALRPWREEAMKRGYASSASLPLCNREKAFGALTIYSADEDAFDANEMILLSELASDLGYGIVSLRTRADHELAMKEIRLMAKLPNESPSPVLRVTPEGNLLWANRASTPLLVAWQSGAGIPEEWRERAATAFRTEGTVEFESVVGDRVFTFLLAPVVEGGYVNIYGLDITDRRKAENVIRLNEARLESLWSIAQYKADGVQDLIDFALNEAIRLTDSQCGCVFVYDERRQEFALTSRVDDPEHSCGVCAETKNWSADTECLWANAVRQRHAVVINHPRESRILKEPQGERRGRPQSQLTVPVFSGEAIVAVIGVANKATDYLHVDMQQLTLLMDSVWKIVERSRAEQKLKESEERFRNTFEHASVGVAHASTDGHWLRVNHKFCEIVGYAPKDLTKLTFMEMTHPEDLPRDLGLARKLLDGEIQTFTVEKRYFRKDGSIVWINLTPSLIRKATGEPDYFIAVIEDISARKQGEETLRRLETAINQAAESIIITDAKAQIQYVNPAFERNTGYSRDEALGKTPRILKSGKQDSAFYASLWNHIKGGDTWSGRVINKRKDGSLFEEETSISPVRSASGKITNYVAVKRDVTEEGKLQRQLRQAQKLEAIGTLASGIAHDFNNLLAIILGYTELSRSAITNNETVINHLDSVLTASYRARDLVAQILAFSREAEGEPRPVDFYLLVKESLKLLRASIPSTIQIKENIDTQSGMVFADPTHVHQVVMNLCTNAYHAMEEFGGTLTVSVSTTQVNHALAAHYPNLHEGPHVKLTISDTGCGMPESVLERIFDPFFTTKPQGKGTGLGLAITHGIVSKLRGCIDVSSTVGTGTTFTILLPRVGKATSVVGTATEAVHQGNGEHVLLVDDEPRILEMAKAVIHSLGYRVSGYGDPETAFEALKASPGEFDVMISDYAMPGMNGVELAELVFRSKPDLPIILSTGLSEVIAEKDAKAIGIRYFLQKPYNRAAMARAIHLSLRSRLTLHGA